MAEFRADRLEAFDLKIEKCGTFRKSVADLEAVPALTHVVGEVGRQRKTSERHRDLPQESPSAISSIGGT
jgi:hypothetical protein